MVHDRIRGKKEIQSDERQSWGMAGHVNIVGIAVIFWTISNCWAVNWKCNGDGQWAFQCSITSNKFLGSGRVPGAECGPFCEKNETCVQFNWKSDDGSATKGTCTIFGGPFNESKVVPNSPVRSDVCGFLISRVHNLGQSTPACESVNSANAPSNDQPINLSLIVGLSLGCGAGVASLTLLITFRIKRMCCFRQTEPRTRTDFVQRLSIETRTVNKYGDHQYEDHLYEEPSFFQTPKKEIPRPPVVIPQHIFSH